MEALLAYNEKLGDDGIILLKVTFPINLWVLSNMRMLFDLRRSEGGLTISVQGPCTSSKVEELKMGCPKTF